MTESPARHEYTGSPARQRSAGGEDLRARLLSVDALVILLLFTATLAYLASFPLHLGTPDEPKPLHEAKRILAGEVMYRDVFDFVLPGWIYLMAALFKLFGTTLATARITAAVIHAVIVALVYAACRRVAVRREVAVAAALICLAICEPAYRVASQHWLATALCTLLLLLCLRPRPSLARVVAMGVALGVLISAHQQRGAFMAFAVAAALGAQAALDRYGGAPRRGVGLWSQAAALALGALLILGPLAVELLLRAGVAPVWQAVVTYPLVNYRGRIHAAWGAGGAAGSFPGVLRLLPAVLAITVPRAIGPWWARGDPERARQLTVLTIFCLFSMLSIGYYPDVIHIAFIAPVFLVTIAEVVEWGLCLLPDRVQPSLAWGASLALAVVCVLRLGTNLAVARAQPTQAYASSFGRVDVFPQQVAFLDGLAAKLAAAPTRTLYVHPNAGYLYLLLDARNPTRYEFLFPGFHDAEAWQEIAATLAADPPPYIVTREVLIPPGDPVFRFITQRYASDHAGNRGYVLWSLVDTPAPPAAQPARP